MQIVRGDASRLDDVGPLFKAMHEHHRAGGPRVLPFRSSEEAWDPRRPHYEALLSSGRGHLLLAEDGSRVIGYAMVSERGQGVGRALMEAACAVMRELGADEVMLYVLDGNESALRFYERLGLQPYLHVMLGRVPE
jgi:GNAT superfamily N-acetyltransferase